MQLFRRRGGQGGSTAGRTDGLTTEPKVHIFLTRQKKKFAEELLRVPQVADWTLPVEGVTFKLEGKLSMNLRVQHFAGFHHFITEK